MAKELNDPFLQKFGEHFKKIREGKNISQRELSSRCSIDHSNISKIERGETNITLLTLHELAEALEVKLKKLLDFE